MAISKISGVPVERITRHAPQGQPTKQTIRKKDHQQQTAQSRQAAHERKIHENVELTNRASVRKPDSSPEREAEVEVRQTSTSSSENKPTPSRDGTPTQEPVDF